MFNPTVRGLTVTCLLALISFPAAAIADPLSRTLDSGWTVRLSPDDASVATHPEAAGWLKASVPGAVQTDLLAADKLPDPYIGANEAKVQWVGLSDWQYRSELTVDAAALAHDHVELVFDGLDTFATVRINGKVALTADNMFRGWRIDAKALLHEGVNTIEVDLQSPLKRMKPLVAAMPYVLPGAYDSMFGDEPLGRNSSTYVRKAGYQYGWDWGPRVVTLGIWKPVRLKAWDAARVSDLQLVQTHLDDDLAAVDARLVVPSDTIQKAKVRIDVTAPDGTVQSETQDADLFAGDTPVTVPLRIAHPQRWWPTGYGKPSLYTVKATVTVDGQTVGTVSHRIGLRTIELRRQADQWGKSFELVINGVPIFAKGANLIPFDMFPNRVTPAQQDRILDSAVAANMNILRIWGGGTYQDDHVYDRADELGLMIWQDFMFGGAIIPYDRDFRESTRIEAVEQVKRLRSHPSIVLWAGNNEVQTDWENWGAGTDAVKASVSPEERDRLVIGMVRMFDQVLRGAVDQNSPGTPYWASTPSTDYDGPADQDNDGDRHYWKVWGGKPVEEYLNVTPRFMSEYGLQSFPVMSTLKAFAAPADLEPETSVMRAHQKYDKGNGNKRLMLYITNNYGQPKSFGDFVYLSQLMQADGIELAASHLRASRPQSMGSMYWQINDVWPGASWASIDWYGRWKALQFRAKRFYAPLSVSLLRNNGVTEAHILSDLTAPKTLTWRLSVRDLSGKVLSTRDGTTQVAALSSPLIASLSDAELLKGADARNVQVEFDILDGGAVVAKSFSYAGATKTLALSDPKLSWHVMPVAGGYAIDITAKSAARGVWIDAGDLGDLSDNSFDMAGGETVTVELKSQAALTAVKKALTVRSYYGSAKP